MQTNEIEAHLARLCESSAFANSVRLRDLLRHTVAESLAGRTNSLKESVLGVTVFGRKPGYDSDASSIVRVEFARLRKKLEQYYESEGANESLQLVFPKGTYAPKFMRKDQPAEPAFAGSVVVLPFTCLGTDPDDDCFADGLTDELITALTRVPGLKVVARTSSFKFKGYTDDIRASVRCCRLTPYSKAACAARTINSEFTCNLSTSTTAAISGAAGSSAGSPPFFSSRMRLRRQSLQL